MYIIKRSAHNPLISPVADRSWEARGTFNPSVVKKGSMLHMFYRALSKHDPLVAPDGVSVIGKALSLDGDHFQNRRQFIVPELVWEQAGCEDPRATFFEGKYYIFYAFVI